MKKITVITGHYGSGKTNLAVNLALGLADKREKVTVVDLDIVNPYFRTSDFSELLGERGAALVSTAYANTNLDIPAIAFDIERMAYENGYIIIDAGGDDAGAAVLGRYARALNAFASDSLDVLYVINRYRYSDCDSEAETELMRSIEAASRMRCTGIVNNSNLGAETETRHIVDSLPYAQRVSELTELPLMFNTCWSGIAADIPKKLIVERFVKTVWEREV